MCMIDIQKGSAAFKNSISHPFIWKMQIWIITILYELVSNSAVVVPALPCLGERSPHSPAPGQLLLIQHILGKVAETCSPSGLQFNVNGFTGLCHQAKTEGAVSQPKVVPAENPLKYMLCSARLLSICTVAMKSKIVTAGELESILFQVTSGWS